MAAFASHDETEGGPFPICHPQWLMHLDSRRPEVHFPSFISEIKPLQPQIMAKTLLAIVRQLWRQQALAAASSNSFFREASLAGRRHRYGRRRAGRAGARRHRLLHSLALLHIVAEGEGEEMDSLKCYSSNPISPLSWQKEIVEKIRS